MCKTKTTNNPYKIASVHVRAHDTNEQICLTNVINVFNICPQEARKKPNASKRERKRNKEGIKKQRFNNKMFSFFFREKIVQFNIKQRATIFGLNIKRN